MTTPANAAGTDPRQRQLDHGVGSTAVPSERDAPSIGFINQGG